MGYAYASQNKGVLNLYLRFVRLRDATCKRSAVVSAESRSQVWVHFYDNDPAKPFTQWTQYMLKTADLAQKAVKATYNRSARRTYAVGTSNGGYQVRRAMEEAPNLFDGGVDWEGTYINPYGPNILIDLPPAIRNFPDYVASNYDPNSQAAQNIRGGRLSAGHREPHSVDPSGFVMGAYNASVSGRSPRASGRSALIRRMPRTQPGWATTIIWRGSQFPAFSLTSQQPRRPGRSRSPWLLWRAPWMPCCRPRPRRVPMRRQSMPRARATMTSAMRNTDSTKCRMAITSRASLFRSRNW